VTWEQIIVAQAEALPDEDYALRNWILSQSQELAIEAERNGGIALV